MDDFPSNSRREPTPIVKGEPKKEDPKLEKVIVGQAHIRKPSLFKKFSHTFVKGDPREIAAYVFWEVMIPAGKDMIFSGGQEFLSGTMFGYDGHRGSRPSPASGRNHTNYSRYSKEEPRAREITTKGRRTHNFGEIVLESRQEADTILNRMGDLIDRYEVVTVADLYEISEVSGSSYVDRNWGWDNLSTAGMRRIRGGGYVLDLPEPIYLDK